MVSYSSLSHAPSSNSSISFCTQSSISPINKPATKDGRTLQLTSRKKAKRARSGETRPRHEPSCVLYVNIRKLRDGSLGVWSGSNSFVNNGGARIGYVGLKLLERS